MAPQTHPLLLPKFQILDKIHHTPAQYASLSSSQYLICIKKMPLMNHVEVESSSSCMEELTGIIAELSATITQVQATLARMETRLANLETNRRTDNH